MKSRTCDELHAAHRRMTDEIVASYSRFQADYGRRSRTVLLPSTAEVMDAVARLVVNGADNLDDYGWARVEELRRMYDRATRLAMELTLRCGGCVRRRAL